MIMIVVLFQTILQLVVILPFVLILLERNKLNYIRVLIFSLCFLAYPIILSLPNIYIDFIKSSWNWDGKILGTIFGILCFFLFRKFFPKNNFFRLKQERKNIKTVIIVSIGAIIFTGIRWLIFSKYKFDIETLLFQLTLPGIDEEILFRGILLGLLMSCLKDKIFFIKNTSIIIMAVLFGLVHAIRIDVTSWSINFDLFSFILTGLYGYIFGWITVKTRSIILPIFVHNFANFFGYFVAMIK
jgi:membrane protease YdiL (CAAX protease family)